MPQLFKFEPPHVGSYNEWIFQTRSSGLGAGTSRPRPDLQSALVCHLFLTSPSLNARLSWIRYWRRKW